MNHAAPLRTGQVGAAARGRGGSVGEIGQWPEQRGGHLADRGALFRWQQRRGTTLS